MTNAIREYFRTIGIEPGIRPSVAGCKEPTCIAGTMYGPTGRTFKKMDGTIDEVWELQPCPHCAERLCASCGGTGTVQLDVSPSHPDFGKWFPCPAHCPSAVAMSERRRERLLSRAAVPAGYSAFTFETFAALPNAQLEGKEQAYLAAQAFAANAAEGCWVNRADIGAQFGASVEDDVRNWLVFYGANGRGKTGLAVATLNALLADGVPVRYVRLQDWIEAMQRRYDAERRREGFDDAFADMTDAGDVLDVIRTAPVLLVDEFDLPDRSENKDAIVWKLINYRYEHVLPTLLTTNLDPDGMEARWGLMVSSRIGQRAHWIEVGGASLRETPAAFEWEG